MSYAGSVPGVLGATIRDSSHLPERLQGAKRIDPWTDVLPGLVLFNVPGVARYLVADGATIDVQPAAGADRNSVELFLHGSARGSLIHQRGELALEAATVLSPGGAAIALSSYSAIGKSTVAAELCRRGWSLVADDITRVTWTGGRVMAWPSHDALKLWRDACVRFGTTIEDLPRTREGMEKFYVKMPSASSPATLKAVIRLYVGQQPRMRDVPVAHCAALLSECTFRRRQIAALKQQTGHEQMLRIVASACRVMALNGARDVPSEVLADHIVRAVS
jgi:hypothetical protein